uniref:BED-type domain-containing protein n=1 Tax=Steinernema glaseri TaxID=37863 RepID=A0A1I7XYM1_9BILA
MSTSVVWSHFNKCGSRAQCLHCSKKYELNSTSTTSRLLNHLRTVHPGKMKEAEKRQRTEAAENMEDQPDSKKVCQTRIDQFTEGAQLEYSGRFNRLVLNFIAESNNSANIVEMSSFRELLKFCNSRYKMPSRRQLLGSVLDKQHQVEMKRLADLYMKKFIGLTVDSYTKSRHSLFSITACSLSKEFSVLNNIIALIPCAGIKHTGSNLAELITNRFTALGLDTEAIVCITRDGATNMVAMSRSLGKESVHCFAHCLNLVVEGAVEKSSAVQRLVAKAVAVVNSFQRSNTSADMLYNIEEKETGSATRLKTFSKTRWNSLFESVSSVTAKEEWLLLFTKGHKNKTPQTEAISKLSAQDYMALREIERILQPFADVTSMVSARNAHIGIIPYYCRKIIKYCEGYKPVEDSDGVFKQFSVNLLNECTRRFDQYGTEIVEFAAYLDPRFHKKPQVFRVEKWEAIELRFKQHLMGIFASATATTDNQDAVDCDEGFEEELTNDPVEVVGNSLQRHWFDDDEEDDTTTDISEVVLSQESKEIEEELRRFDESCLIDLPTYANPGHDTALEWWSKRYINFPKLAEEARRFFAMQASSVDSERAFSQASLLFSNKLRSRLSTEKAEKLLLIKQSVKNISNKPDPDQEEEDCSSDESEA